MDLSKYAGLTILLELGNGPTDGWHNETAYWAKIAIEEVGDAEVPAQVSTGSPPG